MFHKSKKILFLNFPLLAIDIDECLSVPCENGGGCTDAVNSYTCSCTAGYDGTHCQTGELDASRESH